MRALYDVSILLALLDNHHPGHADVSKWVEVNLEQGWLSCPLTQNGYLRVRSQPSYPRPLGLAEAYGQLLDASSSQHHQFIADDISLLDDTLVRFRDLTGPRQLTDIYLMALAVAHGARLVTLDKRILLTPVAGATEDHLLVL